MKNVEKKIKDQTDILSNAYITLSGKKINTKQAQRTSTTRSKQIKMYHSKSLSRCKSSYPTHAPLKSPGLRCPGPTEIHIRN
jgi:hypothetical protein